MLRLFGGNPIVGVLLGAALLTGGLLTHRPVLAIAGGFVGVMSVVRLVSGRGGQPGRRGGGTKP